MAEEKDEVPVVRRAYPESLSETVEERTFETESPDIRTVSPEDLGTWLGQGWSDLWQRPVALAHGLVVALLGLLVLGWSWNEPWMAVSLLTGFLLVGPVLAVGVNYLALKREQGEPGGFGFGWIWEGLTGPVLAFALLLAILFSIWASGIWVWIAVLNVGELSLMGELPQLFGAMLTSGTGLVTLAGILVAVILFSLAAFVLSLVTLPALIDHRVRDELPQKTLIGAIGISLKAFNHNRGTLLVWGIIITILFLISVATALLALIVIFPWLGFAMWRGYRALVVTE